MTMAPADPRRTRAMKEMMVTDADLQSQLDAFRAAAAAGDDHAAAALATYYQEHQNRSAPDTRLTEAQVEAMRAAGVAWCREQEFDTLCRDWLDMRTRLETAESLVREVMTGMSTLALIPGSDRTRTRMVCEVDTSWVHRSAEYARQPTEGGAS